MTLRIPASVSSREAVSDLIEGRLSSQGGRTEPVRLATRLIIEEGLQAEVHEALDREYCGHGAGGGYRNGVRCGRLKTAEGSIDCCAPQVAGTAEPFRSELRGHLKGRWEALEGPAIEMLARGLSVRGIEDALKDGQGRLLLSRTAVSEIGERLWADDRDFAGRDLSGHDIACLFVDGLAERIRPGQKRGPVLAARGFTSEGRKVLLHLMAGPKEDHGTVSAFFQDMRGQDMRGQDMRGRGLTDPLPVVPDGAPGICQGAWDMLSSIGQAALPGAPHAQPGGQGTGGSVARPQGPCHGCLSGAVPGHCPRPGRRTGGRLRKQVARRRCLPHGRFRGVHRTFGNAGHPPSGNVNDQSCGTAVPARARASEDHPQRVRREGRAEAHVRRHEPRWRALAGRQDQRFRATPDGCHQG